MGGFHGQERFGFKDETGRSGRLRLRQIVCKRAMEGLTVASLKLPLILYLGIQPLSCLTFSEAGIFFIVCIEMKRRGSKLSC